MQGPTWERTDQDPWSALPSELPGIGCFPSDPGDTMWREPPEKPIQPEEQMYNYSVETLDFVVISYVTLGS